MTTERKWLWRQIRERKLAKRKRLERSEQDTPAAPTPEPAPAPQQAMRRVRAAIRSKRQRLTGKRPDLHVPPGVYGLAFGQRRVITNDRGKLTIIADAVP